MSQSPQTGQVYFNVFSLVLTKRNKKFCLNPLKRVKFISILQGNGNRYRLLYRSQSPQTGQVYFNEGLILVDEVTEHVSIPSNGSSLFQCYRWDLTLSPENCLNPLKRVKFISISSRQH